MSLLRGLCGIIIISLVILYLNNSDSLDLSTSCSNLDYFKQTVFHGRVIKKYVDQSNHRLKTIQIQDRDQVFEYVLIQDTSGFYEYVKPGDSLLKLKNDDHIKLIRDGLNRKFKIWYGCDK